jgi:hypothetical protein
MRHTMLIRVDEENQIYTLSKIRGTAPCVRSYLNIAQVSVVERHIDARPGLSCSD